MSLYPGSYRFVVEFEKKLTKNLNGLTIKDRIHFPSEKDAYSWVNDIKRLDNGARFINFSVKAVA